MMKGAETMSNLKDLEKAVDAFELAETAGHSKTCPHGFRVDRCAVVYADLGRPEDGCPSLELKVVARG